MTASVLKQNSNSQKVKKNIFIMTKHNTLQNNT